MRKGERKKGFGKMDGDTPDGVGGKPARGPKVDGADPSRLSAAAHHTGGNHHFQAEHGRRDMPGMPGGSRSLMDE